jgi:hypothetical protein
MARNTSGRINSGRRVSKETRVLENHPNDPLYQNRKKHLDATNPVPSKDRDPEVQTSLYMKTTSTRHNPSIPRKLKQSEIPDGRKLEETQKFLDAFTERINNMAEKVGRRGSEFCSKNYLQPICAEVSDVLEKFRKWNLRDLSDSGSVLRKPESKSTPECPAKEWDYFDQTDRKRLKDDAKQLSKAMDEFFKGRKFKVDVCTKADGTISCLTSKEELPPFKQKYRFAFCLKSVPVSWVAYDERTEF